MPFHFIDSPGRLRPAIKSEYFLALGCSVSVVICPSLFGQNIKFFKSSQNIQEVVIIMTELTSEDVALLTQKLGIAEESVLKQHAAYLGGLTIINTDLKGNPGCARALALSLAKIQ